MSPKHSTVQCCPVCAESFNKSSRLLVKCNQTKCNFECCRNCCKTFLLNRSGEPCCMSCNSPWDRSFMCQNFEKTFMTRDYKEYRENLLYQREVALFAATQSYVEREIEIENIQKQIQSHELEIQRLNNQLSEILNNKRTSTQRRQFVRKCPNDNCHGFLNTSFSCDLCGCKTCSKCREIVTDCREIINVQEVTHAQKTTEQETHACKPEILESIKLLEQDTKPCPKCTTPIYKIGGCSQMYCVECHTAFDWVTLRIENGTIHNPHYFEYLRKQNGGVAPRNPLDIQCGRELDAHMVIALVDKFDNHLPDGWTAILNRTGQVLYYRHNTGRVMYSNPIESHPVVEACRRVIHLREVNLPVFNVPNRLDQNLQLRIDYMRNRINKEHFKRTLQKREKDILKKQEISQILGMYISCMTDLFYRVVNNSHTDSTILQEMHQLREYTNKCLQHTSKTYNCKEYVIDKQFVLL